MPLPQSVATWLNQHFSKPKVDPEWLNDCCEWLTHDQGISPVTAFPQFVAALTSQLLQSDLKDSMLHGTGLDPAMATATSALQGPPVLVQVIAITEIGSSAFQLEQTRAAREERTKAGQGNVEGEEDGDVEVEGEGPMPKYPRGTLRFQLSDGATVFDAMEYRPLPALTLGNTPLGYKMQLKGTHFQNGMAFLEPKTVDLLGEQTADLDENRERDFKRGLRVRLGRPLSPEPPQNGQAAAPAPAPDVRSPLREISPPPVPDYPQHDDDINMEPRRRLPVGSTVGNTSGRSTAAEDRTTRPMASLPSRSIPNSSASTTSSYFTQKPNTNTTGAAGGSKSASSKEERDRAIALALQGMDNPPTTRQLVTGTASSSQRSATLVGSEPRDPSFDFDLLDEFDNDENAPPASSSSQSKGKAPAGGLSKPAAAGAARGSSPDYFMDDDDELDPATLQQLLELENTGSGVPPGASTTLPPGSSKTAVATPAPTGGGGSSAAAPPRPRSPSASQPKLSQVPGSDVIEIGDTDDEDEEMLGADDKENEPVQARSVRRRVEREYSGIEILGPPTRSQHTSGRRPTANLRAIGSVLDLSDSE